MTEAKPFQVATTKAVLNAIRSPKGSRRFLVADEVGLGKTVVAQGVVQELMADKLRRSKGPLVVFYVCSSLAIAAQNRRKLLEVIPSAERDAAVCPVDRLTLVGTRDRPSHPSLNLYTLTPDTSIPLREGRSRKGQQSERALIFALVKHRYPNILKVFRQDDFRQKSIPARADHAWIGWVRYYKDVVQKNASLRREFYEALRREFDVAEGQWLMPAIEKLGKDRLEFIGRMRSALAAANLNRLNPDLVIFDEFQRFQDLVKEQSDLPHSRVLRLLRGEQIEDPPGLVLLSATPYKPYARRWEERDGSEHKKDFLDLVSFLYGGGSSAVAKKKACEQSFRAMETELRLGRINSAGFLNAKARIEGVLRPIMSRTERFAHPDGSRTVKIRTESMDLHVKDVRVYKEMAATFQEADRAWVVPYWSSIPLPAQTMGPSYQAWKRRNSAKSNGTPALSEDDRNRFSRPSEWPHPRLRILERLAPPEKLALPWVAPSLPWWTLAGKWKTDGKPVVASKLLVFSRYRAVPPTIAAFLSYSLECRYLNKGRADYETVSRRRALQARPKREALLGYFHPSPWVVRTTEPLAATVRTHSGIKRELAQQIRASLLEAGIRIAGDTRRPLWRLLPKIERRVGTWRYAHRAWQELGGQVSKAEDSESALTGLVSRWDEEARQSQLSEISPLELDRLADYALSAPGIVMARALQRHWPGAVSEEGFKKTLDAVWLGLRSYLDQPWFVKALGGGERHFPESLQRAVFEGNLESVLDEHLWITSRLQSLSGSGLADELKDALRLRSSVFFLHPVNGEGQRFTLRCHAALPFTEGRMLVQGPGEAQEEKPLRPDELRKAFNSPFWPHILATTSVGQEGLDFHCWCESLVHWDLAPDPVAHEQRQGRIQRYGGLSIRTALAKLLGQDVLAAQKASSSPWAELASRADKEPSLNDGSGLKPWWILPGAEVQNIIFSVPTSEQEARFKLLQEQVLLYRLALGHPNQEDLLEVLRGVPGINEDQIRGACLDLSAYFSRL